MKKKSIVHSIPGGWYGNDPEPEFVDGMTGNVAVDPCHVDAAFRWILRRANILMVSMTSDPNPGVLINYMVKA
jgi:hypothetical protein